MALFFVAAAELVPPLVGRRGLGRERGRPGEDAVGNAVVWLLSLVAILTFNFPLITSGHLIFSICQFYFPPSHPSSYFIGLLEVLVVF